MVKDIPTGIFGLLPHIIHILGDCFIHLPWKCSSNVGVVIRDRLGGSEYGIIAL